MSDEDVQRKKQIVTDYVAATNSGELESSEKSGV